MQGRKHLSGTQWERRWGTSIRSSQRPITLGPSSLSSHIILNRLWVPTPFTEVLCPFGGEVLQQLLGFMVQDILLFVLHCGLPNRRKGKNPLHLTASISFATPFLIAPRFLSSRKTPFLSQKQHNGKQPGAGYPPLPSTSLTASHACTPVFSLTFPS